MQRTKKRGDLSQKYVRAACVRYQRGAVSSSAAFLARLRKERVEETIDTGRTSLAEILVHIASKVNTRTRSYGADTTEAG